MGVDYYTCSNCGTGYRDDSEYCCYCDCGSNFCDDDCGKLKNFTYEYDEDDPEKGHAIVKGIPITCVICRKESANDYVLLEALLKHFKLTRKQAFKIYKNQ